MPKPKQHLVKVQLPLFSSHYEEGIMALVYDEDRTIMEQLPIRSKAEFKTLKKHLPEQGLKGFFYAQAEGKNLILTSPAPWQDW